MLYDTIIIGSGAAGLAAAVYASRAKLDFIVIEKMYKGIGQIAESSRVDNYLGLYGENGYQLGMKFRSHAESLGTEFVEGEAVKIVPESGIHKVVLKDGSSYIAKTVIYAAGTKPRKPDIKGLENFSGRGVSYCAVCDGAFFRNKDTAVIGGGDTAVGDAVFLSKLARRVYIIHRRSEFRANAALCEQAARAENIEMIMNAEAVEISGGSRVQSIRIDQSGMEKTLDVSGVFIAVGAVPSSEPLISTVQTDSAGYIIAGEDCITSEKGIFAAGDVRKKSFRQLLTAAADGANSVYSAEKYLSEEFAK